MRESAGQTPHRTQNRNTETFPERMGTYHEGEFNNEPDTDSALAANREWAGRIRRRWMVSPGAEAIDIPLVVAGREIRDDRKTTACCDPSRLPQKIQAAAFRLTNAEDIDAAQSFKVGSAWDFSNKMGRLSVRRQGTCSGR